MTDTAAPSGETAETETETPLSLNLILTGTEPEVREVLFGGGQHVTILLRFSEDGGIQLTTDAPISATVAGDIQDLGGLLSNIGDLLGSNAEGIATSAEWSA